MITIIFKCFRICSIKFISPTLEFLDSKTSNPLSSGYISTRRSYESKLRARDTHKYLQYSLIRAWALDCQLSSTELRQRLHEGLWWPYVIRPCASIYLCPCSPGLLILHPRDEPVPQTRFNALKTAQCESPPQSEMEPTCPLSQWSSLLHSN